MRIRRGQGVDWLHDREQRDSHQSPGGLRHHCIRHGAHRQGDELEIQGDLRRRTRGVAGPLLRHLNMSTRAGAAWAAWLLAAVYYFFQYSLRSAPAVMMPQISAAFSLDALGAASLAGLFYYGYSPFSLVAGAALDRFGPKVVIPIGAVMAGSGALLFGAGDLMFAQIGRFLQ